MSYHKILVVEEQPLIFASKSQTRQDSNATKNLLKFLSQNLSCSMHVFSNANVLPLLRILLRNKQ